jgi:hypothetical protein
MSSEDYPPDHPDINPVSPNIEWAMKDTRVNVMQVFNEE